jgi:hypothetical protein
MIKFNDFRNITRIHPGQGYNSVVEHLPNRHEALGFIPSTTLKKTKHGLVELLKW